MDVEEFEVVVPFVVLFLVELVEELLVEFVPILFVDEFVMLLPVVFTLGVEFVFELLLELLFVYVPLLDEFD